MLFTRRGLLATAATALADLDIAGALVRSNVYLRIMRWSNSPNSIAWIYNKLTREEGDVHSAIAALKEVATQTCFAQLGHAEINDDFGECFIGTAHGVAMDAATNTVPDRTSSSSRYIHRPGAKRYEFFLDHHKTRSV